MGRKKGKRKKSVYARSAQSAGSQCKAGEERQTGIVRKSLAQRRAAHAFRQISEIKDKGSDHYGNYVSYVKALPAAIIMSGLGQALAMEKAGASKSGDVGAGHRLLYQHMQEWLLKDGKDGWSASYANKEDILEAIIDGSEEAYLKAQAEALEYLEWLKKFAVAYLEDKGRE